jgi:hypothetical protein
VRAETYPIAEQIDLELTVRAGGEDHLLRNLDHQKVPLLSSVKDWLQAIAQRLKVRQQFRMFDREQHWSTLESIAPQRRETLAH